MNRLTYSTSRIRLFIQYGLVWKKPLYILRAMRNVILHRLGLKKSFTLRSLCLGITYACNYNCPHCFTRDMMNKRKKDTYLTVDDYRRIANQAIKMGAISFAFQGGEIWLRKDFRGIIKAFKPYKDYITVTTNGSFINEKTIRELTKLGVDKVLFSLDSLDEEHDKLIQRDGSYKTTIMAIKLTMKSKLKVGINLLLSKKNLYTKGVKRLMEFSHKNHIFLNIILARALGDWKKEKDEVMLSKKDLEYYNKELVPLYPYMHRDLVYNYNGEYGCAAAKESFYINPWGDVLACPFNHTFFGNLKKEPLQKIHARAIKLKWFDHFNSKCLTAEEPLFMEPYFEQVKKSKKGFVDYSFWLKRQKKSN